MLGTLQRAQTSSPLILVLAGNVPKLALIRALNFVACPTRILRESGRGVVGLVLGLQFAEIDTTAIARVCVCAKYTFIFSWSARLFYMTAVNLHVRYPRASKYPIVEVPGPKNHTIHGFWDQSPLGPSGYGSKRVRTVPPCRGGAGWLGYPGAFPGLAASRMRVWYLLYVGGRQRLLSRYLP